MDGLIDGLGTGHINLNSKGSYYVCGNQPILLPLLRFAFYPPIEGFQKFYVVMGAFLGE
jgi:hypothetical protein